MQKSTRFGLRGLCLGLLLVNGSAHASTELYVSVNGADVNNCLATEQSCATIAAAITKASPGSVIHIAAGRYQEHLVIPKDKQLLLRGAGDKETMINGGGNGRVLEIQAGAKVVLENLQVRNGRVVGAPGKPGQGGGIYNAGDLTLRHVRLEQNHVVGGNGSNGRNGGTGHAGGRGRHGENAVLVHGAYRGHNGGHGRTGGAGGVGGHGGHGQGGGLYNQGSLALVNVIINGNHSSGGNGGNGGTGGNGGNGGNGGKGGNGHIDSCIVKNPPERGGNGGTGGKGGTGGNGGNGGLGQGAGLYNAGTITVFSNVL